jgi:hypothetical protein
VHDLGDEILEGKRAMDLGGNDDGVWRGDESVFSDRYADFTKGDFRGKGLSVEDHGFGVAVIDINCKADGVSIFYGIKREKKPTFDTAATM